MLTLQVKNTFETGRYAPENIYNVDETAIKLSTDQRARRVAPKGSPIKSQASLQWADHFTGIATISTFDAPVPPFLLYPGKYLCKQWMQVRDPAPEVMAATTETGYSNSFMFKQWLEKCFDPYTKERANGAWRLIFMDGHKTYDQVEFLEACWDRKIAVAVFPPHMTSVFQPLDVPFFNVFKQHLHDQINDYQLGSDNSRAPKGALFLWTQRAWAATATRTQIKAAWKKSGLFPLVNMSRGLLEVTPEKEVPQTNPETPHSARMLQSLKSLKRRGLVTPDVYIEKVERSLDGAFASAVLTEHREKKRKAAEKLEREVRGGGKRTRYPAGVVYSLEYQKTHEKELAEQKAAETHAKEKKAAKRKSEQPRGRQKTVQQPVAGPSGNY